MRKKYLGIILILIFIISVVSTLNQVPQSKPGDTPKPEAQRAYSPTSMNYTWSDAWNGPENNPLPDSDSVPYRNVIQNPSGELGSYNSVTDWIPSWNGGTGSYYPAYTQYIYGGKSILLATAAVAGANWARLSQYPSLTMSSTTILQGWIRIDTAPTANEYGGIVIVFRDVSGAVRTINYFIRNAAGGGTILIGTAANTWYYVCRNITADSLYFTWSAPDMLVNIHLFVNDAIGLSVTGYFDSLYLGNDVVMYQGSNPWYNNEFEHPVVVGAAPNDYPTGWTAGLGSNGGVSFQYTSVPSAWTTYLHYWYASINQGGINNGWKSCYYTLGTNPAKYLSFAIEDRSSVVANVVNSIEIMDTTAGKCLYYEFSDDAAAIRPETANYKQVIHEQIALTTWYYRIKDWQTDWAAVGQFGVAPTMADTWRIAINCTNFAAGANWASSWWDAIWMGNTLPPKYSCFMFGDFRNIAWDADFSGEYTGWLDEYGFDYDGLFVADDIGAATFRYSQITCMIPSQNYDTRHITFGMGNSKVLSWTNGAGIEQLLVQPWNQTRTAWVQGTTEDYIDIWNTGQMFYPFGSTMTFHVTPTNTGYFIVYIGDSSGAGGAIDSRIVLRWMSIEISASDTDVSISYYDLDGWGVDYWFVQTYVNGTRQPNAQFTLANAVGSVLNITVTDYFGNIVYQDLDYPVTSTTTILDIQLELVSSTLQSYGLTRCDIYGNVTFSELFEEPLNPAIWDSVVVGDLTVANGRLNETTEVPGDIVFLYTLDTYPTASTVTVYATTDNILDNYGISMMGYDAPFPGGDEWWVLMTNPGVGEWTLMARQVGLIGARDVGGVVAANTWYKIVITMVDNYIWATVYNPDETINVQLETWYDDQPAAWSYALENAADGPTFTFYDLFIVQGNLGYSKTLTFYDAGNTLLMPDDYVFNGTAWNSGIRFQTATTISLAINRFVQLVEDVKPSSLIFYKLDGTTFPRNSFNVTVFNTLYPVASGGFCMGFECNSFLSRISETTHIHVYDVFDNLIIDTDYSYSDAIKISMDANNIKVYLRDDALGYFYFYRDATTRPVWHEWIWGQVDYFEANMYDGTYHFDVWYVNASMPGGGCWANYTVAVTADYAIFVSSSLIWDIYTSLITTEESIINLQVIFNNQLWNIANVMTSVETEMENLGDLQDAMNDYVTGLVQTQDQTFWFVILIIILIIGVVGLAVANLKKKHLQTPYYNTHFSNVERKDLNDLVKKKKVK